jgi:hypothetical protein
MVFDAHIALAFALLMQTPASNTEIGYHLTVPEGFVDYPEGRATNPRMISCWREETEDSTAATLALCVQRLGLTMGRDTLRSSDIPARTEIRRFRWRDLDLQGFLTHVERDGDDFVALTVQVPLRKEAIQVVVGGPASEEPRADAVMRQTLASLEGESNWLTREQQAEKIGEVAGYWISGIAGVFFLRWVYRRRRRSA